MPVLVKMNKHNEYVNVPEFVGLCILSFGDSFDEDSFIMLFNAF